MKISTTSDQVLLAIKTSSMGTTEISEVINKRRSCAGAAVTKLLRKNAIHVCEWRTLPNTNVQYAIYKYGAGTSMPFVKSQVLTFNERQREKRRVLEEMLAAGNPVKRMDIVAAMFGPLAPAPSLSFDFNIYKR